MGEGKVYSRRISSEEARESYILVLKNRLPFFPPVGKRFPLVGNQVRASVRVESYSCTCRGPDEPHEHYFIRWDALKAEDTVEIRKAPHNQMEYLIRIHR
jgi:hypothetical protein